MQLDRKMEGEREGFEQDIISVDYQQGRLLLCTAPFSRFPSLAGRQGDVSEVSFCFTTSLYPPPLFPSSLPYTSSRRRTTYETKIEQIFCGVPEAGTSKLNANS